MARAHSLTYTSCATQTTHTHRHTTLHIMHAYIIHVYTCISAHSLLTVNHSMCCSYPTNHKFSQCRGLENKPFIILNKCRVSLHILLYVVYSYTYNGELLQHIPDNNVPYTQYTTIDTQACPIFCHVFRVYKCTGKQMFPQRKKNTLTHTHTQPCVLQ